MVRTWRVMIIMVLANMAHIIHSKPYSGLGFQVNIPKTRHFRNLEQTFRIAGTLINLLRFQASSLGRGPGTERL
jgi:hypothetical protein